VLHNAFIAAGIPCFTPEVGAGRRVDMDAIQIFVEGTMNVTTVRLKLEQEQLARVVGWFDLGRIGREGR